MLRLQVAHLVDGYASAVCDALMMLMLAIVLNVDLARFVVFVLPLLLVVVVRLRWIAQ